MKGPVFLTLAALAAQAVSAVPHHRDHKYLHQRQVDLSGTVVTITKTVVEPSAVIWVDDAGNTISTEFRGPPPTAAANANIQPAPAAFAGIANAIANPGADLTKAASSPSSTAAGAGNGGYGICYDMINAQTQCKSADQVDKDFTFLAQNGYKQVRTYDIGCDVGVLAQKAGAHGLKLFAGINGVSNVAGDLQKLIGYINGNWSNIDTINIGNEQVNQGAATVAQVIAAVDAGRGILRAAGFPGNVVTVDVFNQFIANPTLASTSDYVAANAHGYFDTSNTAANNGQWLQKEYAQLQAIAGGKKVVITESGWPHAGSPNGGAHADPTEQGTAIAGIKQAFADKQDSLYVFQAYDATYKQPGAMGIERSFGLYGSN